MRVPLGVLGVLGVFGCAVGGVACVTPSVGAEGGPPGADSALTDGAPRDRQTPAVDADAAPTDAPPADARAPDAARPASENDLIFTTPSGDPPALSPTLVALTYVGGANSQYVRSVRFEDDGAIVAAGPGWTLRASPDGTGGRIEGDVSVDDRGSFDERPPLVADPGRAYGDPSRGLTYRVGYRQAGGALQLPVVRAQREGANVWSQWAYAVADVSAAMLTADTRCYQAWGLPGGLLGVQCWTDGGNSVLAKEPGMLSSPGFDPQWARMGYQRSPGGVATAYAVLDPDDGGRVVSGTFVYSMPGAVATDAYGRTYVARPGSSRSGGAPPANPFAQSETAASGVLALDPRLQRVLFNARIGGTCTGSGARQGFGVIAVRGPILVLGGTTCASDLRTVEGPQPRPGGGQDGMLAVLRLW